MVLALVAALFSMVAVAPSASAVTAVSATRTVSGFPRWYEDQGGTRLEPCLDPNDVRCVVLSNLPIYDAAQPTVWPTNFPDEWFYAIADSDVLNTPGCAGTRPGKALVRHALEGTFVNGEPVPGDQMVFARTRITVSSGLCPGQNYTFTTPYGAITLQMDSTGGVARNQATTDIGCLAAPCDFAVPLTAPMFRSFLRWDPAVAPAATPGYLSADAGVLHPIVGAAGPGSANLFRVTGPGLAAPLQTNLFTVSGKIAGPLQSAPEAADFGNQPTNIPSPSRQIRFTNVSPGPLTLGAISVNPPTAPFSIDPAVPTTCTGTIAKDASCTVNVIFAPGTTDPFSANLEIAHNGFRSPTQVPLTGSGTAAVAPSVTSAPSSLDFGRILIGTSSAPRGVVVHNNGPGSWFADSVTVVDVPGGQVGNAQRFLPIRGNDCPAAGLAPGTGCTILVDFEPTSQQPSAAQLRVNGHVGATAVNLTADLTGRGGIATASAGTDGLGPDGVGADGFTTWYQDDRGVRLNQCLVNDPAKCVLLADPTFNPANPVSFPANYPGEAFYYALDSDIMTTPGCGTSPAGRAGFRAATEQTFVSGNPVAGEQMVFNRLRMNVTSGLCPGRDYTFVHPYGEFTFTADVDGGLPRSPGTIDVGCAPSTGAPCNFNAAVLSPVSDGYVRWDTTAPAAPAGYLGDAEVLHTVAGAPYAKPGSATPQNKVELIDTTDNSVVASTNQFTVMGQVDPTQPVTRYQTVNPSSLSFGSQDVGTTSAAQTVRVDSVGTAALNVTGATVTGPDAAAFTAATTCANQAVGTNCPVTVTFTPTAGGTANATLNVTSDAANGFTGSIPLTGTGVVPNAPVISVAPTTVAFGTQRVGTAAAAKTVTVSNIGTQPLTVSGVTLGGTDAADFTATGCAAAVPAGGTCTITVGFSPSVVGSRTATVTIASDAVNTPSVVVDLTGTGVAPAISVSPASLAFGNQAVATTSAAQTVTVTNTGTAPLDITALTLGGTDGADFAATGCAAAVAPGRTCTVSVTFRPGAAGAKAADLTIASNADTQAAPVALTGTGVQAQIAVSANLLTYTDQLVGSTSAAQTITVSNPGTSPLTVTGLTLGGADAADFTASGCAAAVAPGGTCTVSVAFTPAAIGSRTATLTIGSNAAGAAVTVALTGTGALPQIAVTPTTLAFGNVAVGTTPTAQVVTVSNPGTVPLTVSGLTLGGTAPGDFTASGCVGPVTPGGSCTLVVTITPAATGARSATLTIASNAPGAAPVVALTGTGIQATLSVTPTSLAFGTVDAGTTSAAQTVTVSNTGTAPLTVSGVTLAGTNATEFGTTNGCTAAVAPGGSCTVSVTFAPTANGVRGASLTITSNAGSAAVALSGVGRVLAPVLSAAPAAVTFTGVAVGGTGTAQTVTVTNTGTAPLTVSGVSLGGTNPGDFTSTNGCTAAVPAGGTCTVTVGFRPTAAGTRAATLAVASDGGTGSVTLAGTGLATVSAALTPGAVTFPAVEVGTAGAAQTLTLTNTGSTPLTVTGTTFGGANPAEFRVVSSTCGVVPLNGTCTVGVASTPTATGARTATLTVGTASGPVPVTVQLNGTGQSLGTCPAITGWRGQYFANAALTGTPTLCRNDAAVAFAFGSGAPAAGLPADNFSVRWSRTQAFTAGIYTFTANTDDGARLYVDGALQFDAFSAGPGVRTATVPLTAANHTVVLEYREGIATATANLSWTSVPDPCPATVTGWKGEYFGNNALTGAPTLCRNDAAVAFSFGSGAPAAGLPADNFSIRWTRTASFPTTGTYAFTVNTDDGARLIVDGVRYLDAFTAGPGNRIVNVALTAGDHTVVVEYVDTGATALANVSWTLIPGSVCPATITGFKAELFTNATLTGGPSLCRDDAAVNVDWGNAAPAAGFPADNFSVRWTRTQNFAGGTYTFSAGADDGVRLYIDGVRVIDSFVNTLFSVRTTSRVLTAGPHTVVMEYNDTGGTARATLSWTPTV